MVMVAVLCLAVQVVVSVAGLFLMASLVWVLVVMVARLLVVPDCQELWQGPAGGWGASWVLPQCWSLPASLSQCPPPESLQLSGCKVASPFGFFVYISLCCQLKPLVGDHL